MKKITITSIKLKNPLLFFKLSLASLQVVRQIKKTNVLDFKSQGIWTLHYTMTLWENEGEIKDFARQGGHLAAMKKSAELASEIRILTIDADKLPKWKVAKKMLKEQGKLYKY